MAEQGLGLGGEAEVAAEVRKEERPDAEAVTGEEELAPLAVPDGKRKVPVQAQEELGTPLLVGVSDHLGVRAGRKGVTEPLQLLAELDVVVELAVLHDPEAAALVGEWLVAALEIDDRESCARHPEAVVEVEPRPVGTAMSELPDEPEEELARGPPATGVYSGQAAHLSHRKRSPCRRKTVATKW